MEEYIFKKASRSEWQKWLNQWKHDYDLEIMKIVNHHKADQCTIYLKRTPKEN